MWEAKLDYTVIYLIDWHDGRKVQFPLFRSRFIAFCSLTISNLYSSKTYSLSLCLSVCVLQCSRQQFQTWRAVCTLPQFLLLKLCSSAKTLELVQMYLEWWNEVPLGPLIKRRSPRNQKKDKTGHSLWACYHRVNAINKYRIWIQIKRVLKYQINS